jgi:hypothetical protein
MSIFSMGRHVKTLFKYTNQKKSNFTCNEMFSTTCRLEETKSHCHIESVKISWKSVNWLSGTYTQTDEQANMAVLIYILCQLYAAKIPRRNTAALCSYAIMPITAYVIRCWARKLCNLATF